MKRVLIIVVGVLCACVLLGSSPSLAANNLLGPYRWSKAPVACGYTNGELTSVSVPSATAKMRGFWTHPLHGWVAKQQYVDIRATLLGQQGSAWASLSSQHHLAKLPRSRAHRWTTLGGFAPFTTLPVGYSGFRVMETMTWYKPTNAHVEGRFSWTAGSYSGGSSSSFCSVGSAPTAAPAAVTTPDLVTISSFVPTGVDGQAKVTFNVGAAHGPTNQVQCTPACPGISTVPTTGQTGLTATIGGYTNGATATIQIKTCNGTYCSAVVSKTTTTYGPIGNPSASAGMSGTTASWSFAVSPNGAPVHVVVHRNGGPGSADIWSGTSGATGTYTASANDGFGYSQTASYTVTVTDASSYGRSGKSITTNQVTSAPPPPPPPSVSVSHGAYASSSGCTCYYVHANTANFPASVTCSITAAYPNTSGFVSWSQGANDSHDSPNWYGYPGHQITVTCSGGGQTASGTTTW